MDVKALDWALSAAADRGGHHRRFLGEWGFWTMGFVRRPCLRSARSAPFPRCT